MLVDEVATSARHNPFGAGKQGDAAAVSGAERDQVRAEFILIPVGQIRDDEPETLQRVDCLNVPNADVRNQWPLVGVQIAGDDLEAVAAAQLANQMPSAGGRFQNGPDT